jgi:hypothetical protein
MALPQKSFKTQVVDTFIDGTVHLPLPHKSEGDARRYAHEVAQRRRGEVRILGQFDQVVAVIMTEA